MSPHRITWVDFAKGLSIILVVNMHTTLGLENAVGVQSSMHWLVEFAESFRMPVFFMVAGLFLHKTIAKPLAEFLDKKVLHFAYFYVLWVLIQCALKCVPDYGFDPTAILGDLAVKMIEPAGTLWFIYVLPLFFLAARATCALPKTAVWLFALFLSLLPSDLVSWKLVGMFSEHWVYFMTGVYAYNTMFKTANVSKDRPLISWLIIAAYVIANAAFVTLKPNMSKEIAHLTLIALSLTSLFAGTLFAAKVADQKWAKIIIYIGHRSLVIYLAFFIFMATSRTIALKLGLDHHLTLLAIVITLISVVGPLVMVQITNKLGLKFLFERPEWVNINPKHATA